LLQVPLAVFADPAGIDQTSGTRQIPDFELLDMTSYLDDPAHDLMPRHHRKDTRKPIVLDLMKVGMTNSAKQDIELNIMRTDFATFETPRRQVRSWALGRISFDW